MPETLPPLDACGFVRVGDNLWMKCDTCGKSDHFWLDGVVRCRCGARYDHARRPDGATVPVAELVFVPFEKGPVSLRDMEWDPRRIGLIVVVLVALGAALWWFAR